MVVILDTVLSENAQFMAELAGELQALGVMYRVSHGLFPGSVRWKRSTYTRKPHSQELGTQGQHKTVSKSSCQKKSSCYSSIASLDNSDSDSGSCEQFEVQSQQFQSPVTVSSVSSSQSKLTQESGMSLDSVELPSDKELQREMKKRQAEVSRTASLSHLASMSFLCANYSAVSMVLEVKHHHMIT